MLHGICGRGGGHLLGRRPRAGAARATQGGGAAPGAAAAAAAPAVVQPSRSPLPLRQPHRFWAAPPGVRTSLASDTPAYAQPSGAAAAAVADSALPLEVLAKEVAVPALEMGVLAPFDPQCVALVLTQLAALPADVTPVQLSAAFPVSSVALRAQLVPALAWLARALCVSAAGTVDPLTAIKLLRAFALDVARARTIVMMLWADAAASAAERSSHSVMERSVQNAKVTAAIENAMLDVSVLGKQQQGAGAVAGAQRDLPPRA